MLRLLQLHLGTILVSLFILGIVAVIVVKLIRDKKKGHCMGCDCDCSQCPKATFDDKR